MHAHRIGVQTTGTTGQVIDAALGAAPDGEWVEQQQISRVTGL